MAELEDGFFGGFGVCEDSDEGEEHQNFHRWSELAPELKTIVIGYLDFTTRTRLSFCSKSDHDLVNSAPIRIFQIEVKDTGDDNYYISSDSIENISVRIQFGEDYNTSKQLHFIKRGSDMEIGWLKRFMRKRSIAKFHKLEGRNHYEEAVNFVEKWLKLARHALKSLVVEMKNWPLETSTIQCLPQCDILRLGNQNESFLKWWLVKVRPNLKSLQVYNRGSENSLSKEFLEMDHFKMSDNVHIWGNADFTDEHILNMTASGINIQSNTITDRAINHFIKNWVDKKVRKNFQYFTIWMERMAVKDEILKNVTFRPWNSDFENEPWGFCIDWQGHMGRGDCSQIGRNDGSFISATLDIKFGRITFAVTGTRTEYQGQTFTSYKIPRGV